MISIITATYNSKGELPLLIASLRAQTDQGFEWIVADGGSDDGTVEMLRSLEGLRVTVLSQPDFGIYDAINRGLRGASGDFYVAVGADDRLAADAVANYQRAIVRSGADIVTASVVSGNRVIRVRRGPQWLHGAHKYIANHSLATAFRRDLHDRYGFYSPKYPIAADAYFVIRACMGGATVFAGGFVAGNIGDSGVSARDWAGSATEFFRVQLATGRSFAMQALLLNLRLLKGRVPGLRNLLNTVRRWAA
jgi:glycosyltransferase involved in cell wall biosynthesis